MPLVQVSEQGIGHLAAASPSLQHLYVGHHTGAARAGTREGLAQLAEERRKAGGCRVGVAGGGGGTGEGWVRLAEERRNAGQGC